MVGLVPKGVAHFDLEAPQVTENIIFFLLPNLSMLAFSSAIEPLRIANQLTGLQLYNWHTMSEDGKNIVASNGVEIGVDRAIGPTEADSKIFVCSGGQPEHSTSNKVTDWIRLQWRSGRVVGGLCTGAYALARAGILKGKAFTLHWENLIPFKETYAELEPLEQLYAIDNRIWTCSGGSAATDLFLKLIYDQHGPQLSQAVLDMCLHLEHRSETDRQKTSSPKVLGIRSSKLLRIIQFFDENIEESLNLDDVSRDNGISRRQMERLFKRYLKTTPGQYLRSLRLQKARALLSETNLPITSIAMACGFHSTASFSKCFREKFGLSPYSFSVGSL